MSLKPIQQALAIAVFGIGLAAPAGASEPASDEWAFTVTPYLWLPNINGTLKYQWPEDDSDADVGVGPADYFSHLDMLLMLGGEARKGKWSVYADLIFLDFNKADSYMKSFGSELIPASVNLGTQTSLTGEEWLLVAGYALVEQPSTTLDLIGGVRYLNIKASTSWTLSGPIGLLPPTGSLESRSEGLWDAVIGVRGQAQLGNGNWSMPYYADIGSGDSSVTWQAMAGATYRWSWGDTGIAYRHLSYDMPDDGLLQDIEFSGPAVFLSFHF